MKSEKNLKKENLFLNKSIIAKCRECVGGVRIDCKIKDCPLYSFMPHRDETTSFKKKTIVGHSEKN